MNESWIKLFRKFNDWGWYNNPTVKVVFIHFLLNANSEDKEWNGIIIKRGQLAIGRKQLSKLLGISEQSIRTAITKLKSTSEITSKTYNKFSVITVNKFDDYQQSTSKSTNNQPATNQQLTTTKEYKNIRNKEYIYKEKTSKKEKTYTSENLTIQDIANKLISHFKEENNRASKLAPNSFKNLEYWLEVYEPNEIAEAISNIKLDDFWKDKMDLTILFRQSSKGEPVNWIGKLLNVKKTK